MAKNRANKADEEPADEHDGPDAQALQAELDALRAERERAAEESAALRGEVEKLRAQRDQARRDGDERVTQLEAEIERLRGHLTELGNKLERHGGEPKPVSAAGPTRTAVVTAQGGGPVEVEIPADAKYPEAAAVEAFKAKCGIWSLSQQPHVELRG